MAADEDAFYRALCSRDDRFDGTFYVGVETTGIYCRPICPAKTPGRDRCRFFTRSLEAERAGFRACFRCRPETAPGFASVDAVSALSERAVRAIDAGYLNEHSVDDLAAELGVTSRHLRRAVQTEIGVAPVELAQARRLSLAKQLLHDSDVPVTDVAFAAGFSSLRRFNDAFATTFGRSPSRMRKDASETKSKGRGLSLRLDAALPYDWDRLISFVAGRAILGVEVIDGGVYRRTVRTSRGPGTIAVRREGARSVRVDLHLEPGPDLAKIIAKVRRLFDLDARPRIISEHLARDARMRPLVRARPGLRVPGAFDGFEMAVRAVLGQQITVKGATTLCGRLVTAFGDPIPGGEPGLDRLFPTAETIAAESEESLLRIGLIRRRAATIREIARAVATGALSLEPSHDPEATVAALVELPGIGPWTAHYIAMRALRWPDAFPAGDLAVKKAFGVTSEREAERLAEPLRPWRAYAAMHLWNQPHPPVPSPKRRGE